MMAELNDVMSDYEWNISDGSTFNVDHSQKLAQLFGGPKSWGSAITIPEKKNLDTIPKNRIWKGIVEKLLQKDLPTEIGPLANNNNTDISKEAVSRLKKEFLIRNLRPIKNFYAGGRFYPSYYNEKLIEPGIFGTLISLDKSNVPNSNFRVLLKSNQDLTLIIANKLILALGAIPNAFIFSKYFTNQQTFPLGNHISTTIAEIEMINPLPLSNLFQTWYKYDEIFHTYALKRRGFKCSKNAVIFRFHPVEFATSDQDLNSRESHEPTPFERTHFQRYQNKDTNVMKFFINAQIQIDPDKETNYICFNHAVKKISVEQKLTEVKKEAFRHDLKRVIKLFEKPIYKYVKKEKFPRGNIESTAFEFVDDGHYFGTIPVSSQADKNCIDENFESYEHRNLFMIGGSAAPTSIPGHPTLLYLLMTLVFSDRITAR